MHRKSDDRKPLLSKTFWVSLTCLLLLVSGPAWGETFTTDTYIGPDDTTYDNDDIVVDGCVLTVDGAHPFNSLQVINGGTVTHSANADVQEYTLDLTIATDVTVDVTSAIDVDGRGYAAAQGPGAGTSNPSYGAGAGYGGEGGASEYVAGGVGYGSILEPVDLGSGGGNGSGSGGGAGGGAIRLDIGGTLTVDGSLSANGNNGATYSGGGSGGSVYVTAGVMEGSGTISAVGGQGGYLQYTGGGAGGRIALYADFDAFSWVTPAHGGAGKVYGGAGTAYFRETPNPTGVVVIDNNSVVGAWTPLTSPEAFDLAIRHGAIAVPDAALTVGDFAINSGAYMKQRSGGPAVDLTVQGDALIDVGASLDTTGRGHGAVTGPGAGISEASYGSGAGYGGEGGRSQNVLGGPSYGSILAPTDFGSGGGNGSGGSGGSGGGAIRLDVTGTLTIDGSLIADGNNAGPNAGGGSGGSVYLTVDTLAGTGAISANGGLSGQGTYAGPGGGGRIAIEFATDTFAGTMSARTGANGYRFGGAGTIYTKADAAPAGDLLVDNGGNSNGWTPLTSPEAFNLTIANGAIAYPTAAMMIGDLDVAAGGLLTHAAGSTAFDLTVQGNANIDTAGAISADGKGYGASSGPGEGTDHSSYGSGAGYGGEGGVGQSVSGGVAYGSIIAPADLGSGGGNGSGGSGGAGGGLIRLDVSGTLTIDGSLTANGNNGGSNAGGGSGGSIYLTI
ncbi:MAG: hypothetical protein KKB50_10260, partial [Planctomycetes bacterium]|nr:hypothetical protein [Planctomycetota bacterium]